MKTTKEKGQEPSPSPLHRRYIFANRGSHAFVLMLLPFFLSCLHSLLDVSLLASFWASFLLVCLFSISLPICISLFLYSLIPLNDDLNNWSKYLVILINFKLLIHMKPIYKFLLIMCITILNTKYFDLLYRSSFSAVTEGGGRLLPFFFATLPSC